MEVEILIPYALFFGALFAWGCYFILVAPVEQHIFWRKSGDEFCHILSKKYPQLKFQRFMTLAVGSNDERVLRLFTNTLFVHVEALDITPVLLRNSWIECSDEGLAIVAIELLPDDLIGAS